VRLGIDATCWANNRGYGRFTREIVTAMARRAPDVQFICFLDPKSADCFELRGPNVTRIVVPVSEAPSEAASASGSRSIADMLRMTRAVARERLDVFFSPSVYAYFPLPFRLSAVVTIHDAIAERFPELILPTLRARLFWRMKTWLAVHQARRILTVSLYAAREVARAYRIPIETIAVTAEAPSAAYRPAHDVASVRRVARSVGLDDSARWYTYVGGFNPHKNVPSIVRAHAIVAGEMGANAPYLLLVGTLDADVFHGDQPAIRATIDDAATAHLVRWTGYLDDERIALLHSGAIALLLPSESEGFGLPAVEAAACNTPVIATTESPLPELLDGGGFFVRPGDEAGLIDAMRRLATDADLRAQMGARAGEHARQLSWDSAAESCLLAIREAAPQPVSNRGASSGEHRGSP
jgi:glycosyltransferase involved in cell wall biosynthesis